MPNILDQIVAHKRVEVQKHRQSVPLEVMRERAEATPKPRNFFAAVTRKNVHINVIAEVKKASPSAGLIREDFDPVALAQAYQRGGAACISCLTDERFFQGKLEYIAPIKAAIDLPVLRKDFIIDPYQLYEARAAGADAALLIAECLPEAELVDMLILATELRLTALVEIHDVDSLLKVRPHLGFPHPGYCLLGINNRDLRTMATDLNHTLRLIDMVEDPSILISESGIRTHDDVMRLRQAGVNAILVGEHLMRQHDVEAALRQLRTGKND